MGLEQYDKAFGGKKGAAQKACDAMCVRYGKAKGLRVFYSTVRERTRGGGKGVAARMSGKARRRK